MQMKAKFFKALGDETRLIILELLMEKEMCVGELAKKVKKDQSTVYRHLKQLHEAGIIKTSKENKYLICCVSRKQQLKKLFETIGTCRC